MKFELVILGAVLLGLCGLVQVLATIGPVKSMGLLLVGLFVYFAYRMVLALPLDWPRKK